MRWITQKGNTFFLPKRCAFDDLTAGSVVWAPYTRHRATRSFDYVSLYSGFIRLSDIVHLRLPEWVLRQYQFVKNVPNKSPLDIPTCQDANLMFKFFDSHTFYGVLSTYPTQTSDDYMVWYRGVSHPIMVSPKTMDDAVANLGVSICLLWCKYVKQFLWNLYWIVFYILSRCSWAAEVMELCSCGPRGVKICWGIEGMGSKLEYAHNHRAGSVWWARWGW